MEAKPILAGVIGSPIAHSLSPLIHGEWLRRAGINGRYDRIDVAPGFDNFAHAIDGLRAQGFAGVNVTLPHKENALRYSDWSEEETQHAGAANTLVFQEEKVSAYNTDISGFAAALREGGFNPGDDWNAVILGAGGAARGIICALRSLGVGNIHMANRTRQKVEAIAQTFTGVGVIDWADRDSALRDAALLVNTTSLGMTGQPPLQIELKNIPEDASVADIVYTPLETPLLQSAKAHGLKTIGGLSMLMHQAIPGFTAWFGSEPAVDERLRALLIAELKKRGQL